MSLSLKLSRVRMRRGYGRILRDVETLPTSKVSNFQGPALGSNLRRADEGHISRKKLTPSHGFTGTCPIIKYTSDENHSHAVNTDSTVLMQKRKLKGPPIQVSPKQFL